jgi:hypothetical protein
MHALVDSVHACIGLLPTRTELRQGEPGGILAEMVSLYYRGVGGSSRVDKQGQELVGRVLEKGL